MCVCVEKRIKRNDEVRMKKQRKATEKEVGREERMQRWKELKEERKQG